MGREVVPECFDDVLKVILDQNQISSTQCKKAPGYTMLRKDRRWAWPLEGPPTNTKTYVLGEVWRRKGQPSTLPGRGIRIITTGRRLQNCSLGRMGLCLSLASEAKGIFLILLVVPVFLWWEKKIELRFKNY